MLKKQTMHKINFEVNLYFFQNINDDEKNKSFYPKRVRLFSISISIQ